MNAFLPIRTARLLLREIEPRDFSAILRIHSDPLFQRYEGQPAGEARARTIVEKAQAERQQDPRTHYRLAISMPPDDEMIGHISLSLNYAEIHEWEIGWGVDPRLWGQGVASEAARAMLRFAFTCLDANRVLAICHADNTASRRVMEKIGMQREGRLRETRWLNGQKFDDYVYGILRSDAAWD